MLGAITHNEYVVADLLSRGITLVESVEDINPESTVIIRAHGISPDIREKLKSKKCDVIDCTCPYVEKFTELSGRRVRKEKVSSSPEQRVTRK